MNVTERYKRTEWLHMAILGVVMALCVLVMLTLCFDKGIDFDEAYSYATARDYSVLGIVRKVIADHDTDVPLYYCALRIWMKLFGDSFMASRLFSVAGTVATMVLGITVIRKLWGVRTSLLFIVAVSLAPAMLHVGINIRMYSWTNFLVTASALLAFYIVQDSHKPYLWGLLLLCTLTGLFSHYFMAFYYLVIYLYLLVHLFIQGKREAGKAILCGAAALVPFFIWIIAADFMHFMQPEGAGQNVPDGLSREIWPYLFGTGIRQGNRWGILLVAVTLAGLFLFVRKRERKGEQSFIAVCILAIFIIYALLAVVLTASASHFFTPRHIVHGAAIMWLGIAIVLPRISWPVYLSGLMLAAGLCVANYRQEYSLSYSNTPYLEETERFIAEEMQPGDIVIYTADPKFDLLYTCYMPEQIFMHLGEVEDIEELVGKKVWYFNGDYSVFFDEKDVEKYGISTAYIGHYGFQLIGNCTDFDVYILNVRGMEQ